MKYKARLQIMESRKLSRWGRPVVKTVVVLAGGKLDGVEIPYRVIPEQRARKLMGRDLEVEVAETKVGKLAVVFILDRSVLRTARKRTAIFV